MKDQRTPVLTADDINKILSEASGQHFVLFAVLAGTGMRAGEALALEIPGSSSDCRTISSPISEDAKRFSGMLTYLSGLAAVSKRLIGNRKGGFVLPTANGEPLSASNVLKRDLHAILEKLGIAQAGFHSFRRFRVSYLGKNRVSEDLLQFWIGHAPKTVTDGYSAIAS